MFNIVLFAVFICFFILAFTYSLYICKRIFCIYTPYLISKELEPSYFTTYYMLSKFPGNFEVLLFLTKLYSNTDIVFLNKMKKEVSDSSVLDALIRMKTFELIKGRSR